MDWWPRWKILILFLAFVLGARRRGGAFLGAVVLCLRRRLLLRGLLIAAPSLIRRSSLCRLLSTIRFCAPSASSRFGCRRTLLTPPAGVLLSIGRVNESPQPPDLSLSLVAGIGGRTLLAPTARVGVLFDLSISRRWIVFGPAIDVVSSQRLPSTESPWPQSPESFFSAFCCRRPAPGGQSLVFLRWLLTTHLVPNRHRLSFQR